MESFVQATTGLENDFLALSGGVGGAPVVGDGVELHPGPEGACQLAGVKDVQEGLASPQAYTVFCFYIRWHKKLRRRL